MLSKASMPTKDYLQLPLKIRLDVYSSWVGTSVYALVLDDLSKITFSHNKKNHLLRQITSAEKSYLIDLIKKIKIPFTEGTITENYVCDGGGFGLEIKSKGYKVNFSFIDGQDKESNQSTIAVAGYIKSLLDTSGINLSFGSIN